MTNIHEREDLLALTMLKQVLYSMGLEERKVNNIKWLNAHLEQDYWNHSELNKAVMLLNIVNKELYAYI